MGILPCTCFCSLSFGVACLCPSQSTGEHGAGLGPFLPEKVNAYDVDADTEGE